MIHPVLTGSIRVFPVAIHSICYINIIVHIPVALVVPTVLSLTLSPLLNEAVTVMEYSVPSFRPVSVYIVAVMPVTSSKSVKHSVLLVLE